MEKMTMFNAIYGVSWAWSVNPVTLVRSWRKLVPDLEDDLQDFPNEEIKSEILDMVCAMRSFENINKDNDEEWLDQGFPTFFEWRHI
jgi:hypothetical protein